MNRANRHVIQWAGTAEIQDQLDRLSSRVAAKDSVRIYESSRDEDEDDSRHRLE